jgi:hypothetical protein
MGRSLEAPPDIPSPSLRSGQAARGSAQYFTGTHSDGDRSTDE